MNQWKIPTVIEDIIDIYTLETCRGQATKMEIENMDCVAECVSSSKEHFGMSVYIYI